ncbi:hypothetical protein [Shimia sp.]|uniref:hypothetical protein n=1 Tax=Shimia sp. TaxID=1954381 RepID=UPI003BAD7A9A
MEEREYQLRVRELELDERRVEIESSKAEHLTDSPSLTWSSPLVVAIFAGVFTLLGNAVVSIVQSQNALRLETTKAELNRELELVRTEQARILEMIKTNGDAAQAEKNLKFLLKTGLISDKDTADRLSVYFDQTESSDFPTVSVGGNSPHLRGNEIPFGYTQPSTLPTGISSEDPSSGELLSSSVECKEQSSSVPKQWLCIALKEQGVNEWPGDRTNPRILGYINYLKEKIPDSQASSTIDTLGDNSFWGPVFAAWVLSQSGHADLVPKNYLGSRNWLNVGISTTEPKRGDILVFWRGSPNSYQGNLGFYLEGDESSYKVVMGNNISGYVGVFRMPKARLLDARTYPGAN